MAFYDIDLKDQVAEKHELWTIEKIVGFSKFMYWLKILRKRLGEVDLA